MVTFVAKLVAPVFVVVAGCSAPSRPPIAVDTTGVAPSASTDDLAHVLDKAVDARGLVCPRALRSCRERLHRQLAVFAVTGPTATPRLVSAGDAAVAYWHNARAAWSLALLLDSNCPGEFPESRFLRTLLRLDGRTMTLEAIDSVLAGDGDFRAAAAAPGVTYNRAALPRRPLTAREVRFEIRDRFVRLLADEDRFVIDVENQQVRVPAVLYRHREGIQASYNREHRTAGATLITALLPYATGSAQRRLQLAIGYRVVQREPVARAAVRRE
jgi:hypothetical protein